MKFFNNLPKTTFESTIGSFTISDFFTYLDIEKANIEEGTVNIDNKTTLVEAAYNTYNDPNSFWAFVAANNTINPFSLLEDNAFNYARVAENKISFLLFDTVGVTTNGYAFLPGSVIYPFSANSGPSYFYGYTGSFDLTGRFAVIEESSFYDGYMTIGLQYNGTADFISVNATQDNVTVVQKNLDGSYTWAGTYYTASKKKATDKIVAITNPNDAKVIYREATTYDITIDDYLPESTPIAGATVATTAQQSVNTISKIIQAYAPNELGFVQSSFITTKYN